MKDFYDIYYLSHTFDFDGTKLKEAMFQTLQNRGTNYEKNSFDRVMALVQDEDINIRWRYFLINLNRDDLNFQDVLSCIELFLRPVFTAIISESQFWKIWNNKSYTWV